MEIFVFIRTGGKRISVKLLDESDSALAARLVHFDAAKALCRYDRDRQRLLAVIEASFGTAAPFNELVIEVLNTQVLGLKEASRSTKAVKRFRSAKVQPAAVSRGNRYHAP